MALDDLFRTRTRPQVVHRMLQVLAAGRGDVDPLNFAPTNYVPGDPLRTLLELAGEGIADVERTVEQLGRGGYLQTATGAWLDALVESHYGVTRQPSAFARGQLTFFATAASAVTVPVDMIVGTRSGRRYLTVEEGEVPAGGSLPLAVQAEEPGAAHNVPVGTVTVLHTPLPGLSATNPPGWLTQAGADEESDEALRRRAGLRWAELGGGATRRAYEYWALSAHPSVDRVRVLDDHPRGQGTVDVIVWGAGGIGTEAVAAVDAYIQERRPVTADVAVSAAEEVQVAVELELYAPGGDRDVIAGQVEANLTALQRAGGIGAIFYRSQVIEAAMLVPGVLDAVADLADVVLGPTQVFALAPSLRWRETP